MKLGSPGYAPSLLKSAIYGDARLEGILIAEGTTVPTDGTAGYATGCVFHKTNGSTGTTLYTNEGSITSCAFKAIIAGTGATAAEVDAVADVSAREVAAGAATLALTVAAHEGRTVLCDQAAGCTFTLPSAAAGIVGARFRIVLSVTATSNNDIVQVANSSDYMVGLIFGVSDDGAGGPVKGWATANTGTVATESDTVTLNRTTTGTAVKGQWLEFECIAANVWAVRGMIAQSGTEASPFSVAV